ncbi:MAG: Ferredoxin CarAc [Ignavibacteria bacterium]|nr:Ferredoxin CarAc [Ignavibacteria bacterium]
MQNEYVKICKMEDIKEGIGQRFDIDDENEAAVFKIGDEYYAVDNVCPHNHNAKIYKGDLQDKHVTCPVHGYRFSLLTGEQPDKPGCRLRIFEIKIDGGFLYIKKPGRKIFDFHF